MQQHTAEWQHVMVNFGDCFLEHFPHVISPQSMVNMQYSFVHVLHVSHLWLVTEAATDDYLCGIN